MGQPSGSRMKAKASRHELEEALEGTLGYIMETRAEAAKHDMTADELEEALDAEARARVERLE